LTNIFYKTNIKKLHKKNEKQDQPEKEAFNEHVTLHYLATQHYRQGAQQSIKQKQNRTRGQRTNGVLFQITLNRKL
jgi:hypothetical protein